VKLQQDIGSPSLCFALSLSRAPRPPRTYAIVTWPVVTRVFETTGLVAPLSKFITAAPLIAVVAGTVCEQST
jgi:hypothetical protein